MGSIFRMLGVNRLTLIGLLLASSLLSVNTVKNRVSKPYVESYWESWDAWEHYQNDFGAFLKDMPASAPGSCKGVNLINISFGDYSGGIGGHESTEAIIREGIQAIHDKGGLVKIALGGALYSMGAYIQTPAQATAFCDDMKATSDDIDLDLNNLKGLGLAADQIVYGIMPGHADAASEYVSLEDARTKAAYTLENGLGGMMTWDVNRDCKQRMNYGPGEDNLYQTGKGDGVYLDALSAALNKC